MKIEKIAVLGEVIIPGDSGAWILVLGQKVPTFGQEIFILGQKVPTVGPAQETELELRPPTPQEINAA